jgi:WD40 repeat protein
MGLASQLFKAGDPFRLPELLDRHRPQAGADDRRGFDWWFLRRHRQEARPALHAHSGPLHLLAYTPDGKSLVTAGGNDQQVKLWDLVETGRLHFQRPLRMNSRAGELPLAGFAPGRGLLAAITAADKVTLWNAKTGAELAQLPQARGAFRCSLSRDGRVLAVARPDAVAVWDCVEKRQVCTVPRPDAAVALAPDGQSLATATIDGRSCEFWGTAKGELLGQVMVDLNLTGLAYSPRGTFLLTVDGTRGVVWDVIRRMALEWQPPIGPVRCLAVSNDEQTLAAGGHDGVVRLWGVRTRRLFARYRWQPSPIDCLAFSPDGHSLAAATSEGAVHQLDATARHVPDGLHSTTNGHGFLTWSPDGKTLAVGVAPNPLKLLDGRTGEERTVLDAPFTRFTSVLFSPDRQTVATTALEEKVIRLWDAKTGRPRGVTGPHAESRPPAVFSADGRSLLSLEAEGVRVWDSATGAVRGLLAADRAEYSSVVLSPDGRTLVAGGSVLRVWDLGGGGRPPARPVCTVPLTTSVSHLGITSDGRTLVTGAWTGRVRLWNLSPQGQLTPDGPGLSEQGIGSLFELSLGQHGRTLAAHYLKEVFL